MRFLLGILLLLLTNTTLWAADEAKRILALVDYIGGDYRNAVQSGKIVNADEYTEMTEFSARSLELFTRLKSNEGDKAGIENDLNALAEHIKNKTGDDSVPRLAQRIKDRLIQTYSIATYPRGLPNYEAARLIYMQNCAQCHGESGKGDGPGRESMNPKTPAPANFTDAEFMAGLSPFKIYNTTTFGIDNTAMASFAALPDEQRWQAAAGGSRKRRDIGDFVRRRTLRQDQNAPSRRAGKRHARLPQAWTSGKEIHRPSVDSPHVARRSRGDIRRRR